MKYVLAFVSLLICCRPASPAVVGAAAAGIDGEQQASALVKAYNADDRRALETFFSEHLSSGALEEESAAQRASGLLAERVQSGAVSFVQPPAQTYRNIVEALLRPEHGHVAKLVLLGSHRETGKVSDVLLMPAADPSRIGLLPAKSGPQVFAREVDRYLGSLAADGLFSGSVRITNGSALLFAGAYGYANRDAGTRNTPETRFHIASMGKMFTAVAVGQLVEQGKLRFDETLAEALPDYPNRDAAQKITIEQLLGHRSGLGDVFQAHPGKHGPLKTLSDVLPTFADKPLNFTPGSAFGYSNAGYVTLGAIIERISGLSFETYLRRNIFMPAGITGDPFNISADPNSAIGYSYADDPFRIHAPVHSTVFLKRIGAMGIPATPAGGEYLTAHDVDAFFTALNGGRYINAQTLARLTAAQADAAQGPGRTYAWGFEVYRFGDATIIGHNGGGAGAGIDSTGGTDGRVTITVLTNGDPPTGLNAFESLWRFVLAALPQAS